MLIEQILKFIRDLKQLKNEQTLPLWDLAFYDDFSKKFEGRIPTEQLTNNDIDYLNSQFEKRWKQIAHSKYDYMVNVDPCNQKWVQLAKDLAALTKKSYQQILIPGITNRWDFNDLSLFAETDALEHSYLGPDNTVLYKQTGLHHHLLKSGAVLSTYRDKKLCALTVKEMVRLDASKSTLSLTTGKPIRLWDYLNQNIFPNLQSKGSMPTNLLPPFLELIVLYFKLKATKGNFNLFKQAAKNFFNSLQLSKIEHINFFYGIKIEHKGARYYLLDFLMIIYKAETYNISEHLFSLAKWLYQYHPALKGSSPELQELYKAPSAVVPVQPVKKHSLGHCLSLLLSLFTWKFEVPFYVSKKISFWDRTSTVFSEAASIYESFEDLLEQNVVDKLLPQYELVQKQWIKPGCSWSFYNLATQYESTKKWYTLVNSDSLSKKDVVWYRPEILIHALLRYAHPKPLDAALVNNFLDELIHTYAQKKHELLIQLRVNILFAAFMKKLPAEDREHLKVLLQLYDKKDAKNKFLKNCSRHIVKRISDIQVVDKGNTNPFFGKTHQVDMTKLILSPADLTSISTIIAACKKYVYSPALDLARPLLEKVKNYFDFVTSPIRSEKEKQDAQSVPVLTRGQFY